MNQPPLELDDIPQEIIEAAHKVRVFMDRFTSNGEWTLSGIASYRKYSRLYQEHQELLQQKP
jgi:hypothetical protein